MGTGWLQSYLDASKTSGRNTPFINEHETFKFGASRLYESSYSAVISFKLGDFWVHLKAAVVHGDVPLLLSRRALAAMGMVYDLHDHRADFKALGISNHKLETTSSGHPALLVHPGKEAPPDPKTLYAERHEDRELVFARADSAYTAFVAEVVPSPRPPSPAPASALNGATTWVNSPREQIFYEKKLDTATRNMLTADSLSTNSFLAWWQKTSQLDFWLETPDKMIRIHTTPRKPFFDPGQWQTSQTLLKQRLLCQFGRHAGNMGNPLSEPQGVVSCV